MASKLFIKYEYSEYYAYRYSESDWVCESSGPRNSAWVGSTYYNITRTVDGKNVYTTSGYQEKTIYSIESGTVYGVSTVNKTTLYKIECYFDSEGNAVYAQYSRTLTNTQYLRCDIGSETGFAVTEGNDYPDASAGYTYRRNLNRNDVTYIIMRDSVNGREYAYAPAKESSIIGSNGVLGSINDFVITSGHQLLTHTLVATCGTETLTIDAGVMDGDVSWIPPIEWASQNIVGAEVSIVITCEMYIDGVLVGTPSCKITAAIPDDLVPTCDVTAVDSTGLLDVYGGYIQNVSMATVDVTAEGVYGSTIKEYQVRCGSFSSVASTTTFALPNAGETVITVTVWDTRGRSASATKIINVLEYANPVCTISACYRSDSSGTSDRHGDYAAVIINSSVTNINNINSALYKLGYRIAGVTGWSARGDTWTYIQLAGLDDNFEVSDHMQLVRIEPNNVYEFCIFTSDDIRTDVSSNVMALSTNDIIMHIDRSRMAIGIHKVADQDNSVDFGLPVFGDFHGNFYGTSEAQFRPKRVISDSVDFDGLIVTGIYTGHITDHPSAPRQNCYISLDVTYIPYSDSDSDHAVHQKAVTIGQNDTTLLYERVYTTENGWGDWAEIVGATAHKHVASSAEYSILQTNEYRADSVQLNRGIKTNGDEQSLTGYVLLPWVKVNIESSFRVKIRGVTLGNYNSNGFVHAVYYYRGTCLGYYRFTTSSAFINYESGDYELNLFRSNYAPADSVHLHLGISNSTITKDNIADLVVEFPSDTIDLTNHRISYRCLCGTEPFEPGSGAHSSGVGYISLDASRGNEYLDDVSQAQGHRYGIGCTMCGPYYFGEVEPHTMYDDGNYNSCTYCGWIYS